MLFTTDGTIAAEGWVLLEDDRNLQPVDNVVPVIRQVVLDSWGDDIRDLLNAISAKLTTQALTDLNKQVGFDGETPQMVAHAWLLSAGFDVPSQ